MLIGDAAGARGGPDTSRFHSNRILSRTPASGRGFAVVLLLTLIFIPLRRAEASAAFICVVFLVARCHLHLLPAGMGSGRGSRAPATCSHVVRRAGLRN
jgi:hypothetical protein